MILYQSKKLSVNSAVRTLLLILCIANTLSASLASELAPLVNQLIPFLHSKKVLTLPVDGRYGLSLKPLYNELFRAINHRDASVIRDLTGDAAMKLTGSYKFDTIKRKLFVELFLFDDDKLVFSSGNFLITDGAAEAVPDYRYTFDNGVEEQRLIFPGTIRDKLKALVANGTLPQLLTQIHSFQILGSQGDVLTWHEQQAFEQLQILFGCEINTAAEARLEFDTFGSLNIIAGTDRETIYSLLPQQTSEIKEPSTTYLTPVSYQSETKFERTTPSILTEKRIVSEIKDYFSIEYPSLFNPFIPQKLLNLFPYKEQNNILTGTVNQSVSGTTSVRYQWTSPKKWVLRLKELSKRGRNFNLKCEVVEIIQDPHIPFRFWAVVKQDWQTLDIQGSEKYRDEGFLLVNFDFSSDGIAQKKEFYYRLWFYSYPYEIVQESQSSRSRKIQNDVTHGIEKISGVDLSLKIEIEKAILRSLQ